MAIVEELKGDNIKYRTFIVECPGCEELHVIPIEGPVKWDFNGDMEKPTFSPSLFVNRGRTNPVSHQCHSFIRKGQWEFLTDCSHSLAGQTVPMIEID